MEHRARAGAGPPQELGKGAVCPSFIAETSLHCRCHCLGSTHSTTELHPLYQDDRRPQKGCQRDFIDSDNRLICPHQHRNSCSILRNDPGYQCHRSWLTRLDNEKNFQANFNEHNLLSTCRRVRKARAEGSQDMSTGTGNPTRIKKRANCCAKCSRYGGRRRSLGPIEAT